MNFSVAFFIVLLGASLLFERGAADKCHRKRGICKAVGATCMGVTRANECRFGSYRCCSPPMRGKRRKRHAVYRKWKLL